MSHGRRFILSCLSSSLLLHLKTVTFREANCFTHLDKELETFPFYVLFFLFAIYDISSIRDHILMDCSFASPTNFIDNLKLFINYFMSRHHFIVVLVGFF